MVKFKFLAQFPVDHIIIIIIINYNIFIILVLESFFFFKLALADGFLLEWQQVSSSIQDSFQYSDQCQQYSSLFSLHPSR